MKPTDFAQTLINFETITDLQWHLYYLASSYLEAERMHTFPVTMRFTNFEMQAYKVAYDTEMAGLLVIDGPNETRTYARWADLVAVKITKV